MILVGESLRLQKVRGIPGRMAVGVFCTVSRRFVPLIPCGDATRLHKTVTKPRQRTCVRRHGPTWRLGKRGMSTDGAPVFAGEMGTKNKPDPRVTMRQAVLAGQSDCQIADGSHRIARGNPCWGRVIGQIRIQSFYRQETI